MAVLVSLTCCCDLGTLFSIHQQLSSIQDSLRLSVFGATLHAISSQGQAVFDCRTLARHNVRSHCCLSDMHDGTW